MDIVLKTEKAILSFHDTSYEIEVQTSGLKSSTCAHWAVPSGSNAKDLTTANAFFITPWDLSHRSAHLKNGYTHFKL